MARLPSALDIQRRPAPSETPGIRVGAVDFGALTTSGNAIGKGIADIGKAGLDIDTAQAEVDDYSTKKKLLDFKLATEMELEERIKQLTQDLARAGELGARLAFQLKHTRAPSIGRGR